MVAFLTLSAHDASDKKFRVRGTAFFVAYEDKRVGQDGAFVYLVTNRHIAEPHDDGQALTVDEVTLRLNLKAPVNGRQLEDIALPLGSQHRWYFPEDAAVDLAVMPLFPPQDHYDYLMFPVSRFALRDVVQAQSIAEGDSVVFSGLFAQFAGQRRMEPIVRQGVLAMMPEEKIRTTLGQPGHLYLADVHSFSGNSGSPMFVNLGGLRGGGLTVGFDYRLLGVVSGFVFETADYELQIATTLTGTDKTNSGISIVVPVDELKTLLDSPGLKAQRDSEVARMKK
jgi:hypothetical protein